MREGGLSVFLQLEKEFSVFLQREEEFAADLQREGGILGVFAKREILSILSEGQPRDCFRKGGMLDSFVEMIDKDGTVKFSISFEKRGIRDIFAEGCDSLDF